MKRTGSRSSTVGPAVTRIAAPASLPAPREQRLDGLDDRLRLCQTARPHPAARQIALARVDEADARAAKRRDVRLRRGVVPHVRVHRRGDEHRRARREVQRGQKIIGKSVRELRETVGGGRRDEQQVDARRERDVLDVGVGPGRELRS